MNKQNLSLILTFFVTAAINCFAQLIPLTPLDYHFTAKYTDEVNPGTPWVITPFGNEVRYIQNNTWMAYDNFDFGTGATHAFIEAKPVGAGGGTISVRTGSSTGPILGSVVVPGNASGLHYRTLEIPLPGGISGVQKLYFTFSGGTGYLLETRAFWFPKTPANTKQVGSIINATTFDTESHPGAAPVVANAGILESNTDGSWIAYNGFNFGTGTNRVQIEASAAERGGLVELRTGSSNGPLIGTVDINHTGSWTHYRTFTANLTQDVSGTSDLYLRFVNSKGGVASAPMFNLKRFSFYRVAPPAVAPSQQRLSVYPPVPGLPQSPYYQLSVQKVSNLNALKQNATNYLQPFAWFTKCVDFPAAPGKGSYFDEYIGSWSHTYCNFELDPVTPIVVKITRLNHGGDAPSGPIKTANAHPAHKVISCEVINGEVYVTMNEPALVAVDIDGQLDSRDAPRALPSTFTPSAFPYRNAATGAHSVTIFANPFIEDKPSPTGPGVFAVEPGTLPPTSGNWTTLYFKPGIHNFSVDASGNERQWEMSDAFPLYNGKNYYIPGDAIVYGNMRGGQVNSPSTDIRVYGHGTLSGTKMVHPGDLNPPLEKTLHPTTMMLILGKADNCHYEGITVADPPYHGIGMYAEGPRGTAIRWVKSISWRVNNDALGVGGGVVEDCFFRHQDDGVYVESTSLRRCTFWSDVNGRPLRCSFMSRGAEPNLFSAAETVVEDCDIIYARGVFNSSTTDFGVIGTSDTMDNTTTFNDGTKNTGQTVIFRNIRVTDPRPQRHLIGFSVEEKAKKTFAGFAGVRFEDIEYRYPQTWGWANRIQGRAVAAYNINDAAGNFIETVPARDVFMRYFNFKNVSIAGEWMNQPMLVDPLKFVTAYVSNMITSSPPSSNTLTIQRSSGGTIFHDSAANHFAAGTEIEVSATPSPGFIFGSWGGALAGTTANPATLVMNGNKTVSANFIALPTPAALVQINAGGPAFTAGDGTTYAADGTYSSFNGYAINGIAHGPWPIPAIGNTTDDTLYQRARIGTNFSYHFPMNNGEYEVTLKFADILSTAANQNIFDVVIERNEVISGLDVFATVGKNMAHDRTFSIKVSDGLLNIEFTADLGNAIISAIRVKNASATNFTLQTSQLNGTITLTPEAGSYPAGTSVELTATPRPGFEFSGWGGDLSGTLNPQTVTMNGNKNIICNFTSNASPLARTGWIASASLETENAITAIDGNTSTRWATSIGQTDGQWFQVDMGSSRIFNQVFLDSGNSPNEYPRGYQVSVSADGVNWETPVATGAGFSAKLTVTFPTQTARYIRVTQTGTAADSWWSIAEFNVLYAPETPTLISVSATDSDAGEPANSGTFTFTRSGDLSLPTTVNYSISGTATSGSDYQDLGTLVDFAVNQTIATKTVMVIDDSEIEWPETVDLTLLPGTGYTIVSPSSATVTMSNDDVMATPPANIALAGSWVQGTSRAREPGSNRALVVMLYAEGTATMSASSITYGGQTLTKVVETAFQQGGTGPWSYTGAFVLGETGVAAAASGAIVVNWGSAPTGTGSGADITSAFFSNVNQSSPTGSTSFNGLTGTTIASSLLATSPGDLVIVGGTAGVNGTYTINNGFTRGIAETSATFGDITSAYKVASGTSETPSLTMSASMRQTMVGFVLKNGAPSYNDWVDAYKLVGSNALATADPDGDGVVNLVEYALWLSPMVSDANPVRVDQVNVAGETYLRLSVNRHPAVKDVLIEGLCAETLTNPAEWSTSTTVIETNTDSLYVVRDTVPMGSGGNRFMRLRFRVP